MLIKGEGLNVCGMCVWFVHGIFVCDIYEGVYGMYFVFAWYMFVEDCA